MITEKPRHFLSPLESRPDRPAVTGNSFLDAWDKFVAAVGDKVPRFITGLSLPDGRYSIAWRADSE